MKSFLYFIVTMLVLAAAIGLMIKPAPRGPVSQQRPIYVPAGTVAASYRTSSPPTVTVVYDPRPVVTFGWYNNGTPTAPGYLPTLTVLGLPMTGERPADPTGVGIMLQTADGRSWRADWKEEK